MLPISDILNLLPFTNLKQILIYGFSIKISGPEKKFYNEN